MSDQTETPEVAVESDALGRALHRGHRLLTTHHCACGWEGDNPITHVVDAITSAGFAIVPTVDHEAMRDAFVLQEARRVGRRRAGSE